MPFSNMWGLVRGESQQASNQIALSNDTGIPSYQTRLGNNSQYNTSALNYNWHSPPPQTPAIYQLVENFVHAMGQNGFGVSEMVVSDDTFRELIKHYYRPLAGRYNGSSTVVDPYALKQLCIRIGYGRLTFIPESKKQDTKFNLDKYMETVT